MATKKSLVLARVLVETRVDGIDYKPNQVIEASASVIKGLGEAVDASAAAVKYCLEHEGAKVIPHKAPEDPAIVATRADLTAEIASLEEALAAAADADKPAIQAELDAKQSELADL